MRMGILGGAFNPIHLGHLILALDAAEKGGLDRVLLTPCATPPHKPKEGLADIRHRIAMVERAVADDGVLELSEVDAQRGGITYTVDTLRDLRTAFPGMELVLILGSDCLRELHTWKDIYAVLEFCELLVFQRPGIPVVKAEDIRLKPPWPEKLAAGVHRGHLVEISSSEIRRRIASGRGYRYFVPDSVAAYIRQVGLYGRKASDRSEPKRED
ncbi:MAG TPA: nicotinate (nicotinamide) nucleotide adenylyltransferase [Kiritimatiellae bacterium]|nr:nicotinate (nicotinamide) nucleotide adenylyltransferase [Kiritimatiellia bacterium]